MVVAEACALAHTDSKGVDVSVFDCNLTVIILRKLCSDIQSDVLHIVSEKSKHVSVPRLVPKTAHSTCR